MIHLVKGGFSRGFVFHKEQLIETPVGLALSVAFPLLLVSVADPAWPPPRSCLVGQSSIIILGSGVRAVAMGTPPIWHFDYGFSGDQREKRGKMRGRRRRDSLVLSRGTGTGGGEEEVPKGCISLRWLL